MGWSLQEEQSSVFSRLAEALVEATPEWWLEAVLELIAPATGLGNGVALSIHNIEYPHDLVMPTDEILEAARELELLSVRHGDSWTRCVYRVEREPTGLWRFVTKFERNS